MRNILLFGLVGAIIALIYQFLLLPFVLDPALPCIRPDAASPLLQPECFFSGDYYQARERFRNAAKALGLELTTVPLSSSESLSEYTVDFAFSQGHNESNSLLIHISGTHGTEGFGGSAIQLALMKKNFLNDFTRKHGETKKLPDVLFVHALNPFGMANLRRVNENNVDINRNAMLDESAWKSVLERDPNIAGYETFSYCINPKSPVTYFGTLKAVTTCLYDAWLKGKDLKRTLVTGTYRNNQGVFYGGKSLERSHQILKEYLTVTKKHLIEKVTGRVFIIDVHSGLGPIGRDTILLMESGKDSLYERISKKVFNPYKLALKKRVDETYQTPYDISESTVSDGAGQGYDLTLGTTAENFIELFKNRNLQESLAFCQEFGTEPGIIVGLSIIMDNQQWHYNNKDRKNEAFRVLRAFNPNRRSFQEGIIHRGMKVFMQSLEAASSL